MDKPVRWVSKAEAAREMVISLSTLDRKIRKGEVEVVREGRRVYVRMHGPEYLSDEELLERTIVNLDECERTVRRLRLAASELERERDDTRDAASASEEARRKLEAAYDEERAAHDRAKRVARTLGLIAAVLFALLAVSILVVWLLADVEVSMRRAATGDRTGTERLNSPLLTPLASLSLRPQTPPAFCPLSYLALSTPARSADRRFVHCQSCGCPIEVEGAPESNCLL